MAKVKACYDCIIIGGGATGMMAAISAARTGGRVLILEHEKKLGKKILATGNGKCNFTNANMKDEYFRGDQRLFPILHRFTEKDVVTFFHEIGIYPKQKNGYYYPNSEQASSIVNALIMELERLSIEIITEATLCDVVLKDNGFEAITDQARYIGKTIIFAVGLLASPKLGSDGSAFSIIKNLGHHFTSIVPALCGFYAKGANFKRIAGVRTAASIKIICEGNVLGMDSGELQLTDYGISGIPVFQVSRFASCQLRDKRHPEASICFFPELTEEEILDEWIFRIRCHDGSLFAYELLEGMINQKLIGELLSKAGMKENSTITMGDTSALSALLKSVTDFRITLTKARDYEFAQVCAGGIYTEEIDETTLMSQLIPGLFFCGELLDVDGICGGYNLQWAWSSGYVAGKSAMEYIH